jgi:hypothetical protein
MAIIHVFQVFRVWPELSGLLPHTHFERVSDIIIHFLLNVVDIPSAAAVPNR